MPALQETRQHGGEPRGVPDVLICNENRGFGGGEVHTLALARALQRAQWGARMLCRRGSWLDRAAPPELKRGYASFANEVDVVTVGRAFAELGGVDVAHAHATRDNLLVGIAARLRRKPMVRTLHSFLEPSLSGLARTVLRRYTDRVICVSEAMRAHALEWGLRPERLVVIPNGIDTSRFQPQGKKEARERFGLPASGIVVGAVSGLWNLKGPDLFLRSMARVPDALLLVAGDGPMRGELEVLARDLGIHERTRFLGNLDDPCPVYAASDVIVMASRDDAFPLVALEAQGCGRPVVAFDVGGIREALEEGQTGLLAPSGDTVALAKAAHSLISDPARTARMGDAAADRVRKLFSEEVMVRRITQVYQDVVSDAEIKRRRANPTNGDR